jgi:hypothetical protein
VFIASPGEVAEEREAVSVVVDELRRIIGEIRSVELEAVRWETHAWPDVGEDAQDVINREIGQFDIFVGVMWRRFGTPTKREDSGTSEEFERAYRYFKAYGRPRIMFYFRRAAFYPGSDADLLQFRKVLKFRKKLEKAGVLFWEYEVPLGFERNVREHLMRQILELTNTRKREKAESRKPQARSAVFLSAAREDLPRVRPIYDALTLAGFKPWLDVESLLPGQDWAHEIQRAITHASAFLFFVSRTSAAGSEWLSRELEFATVRAAERDPSHVIPVRLDAIEPPPILHRYQWIDVFETGGVERLIAALKSFKQKRPGHRVKSR